MRNVVCLLICTGVTGLVLSAPSPIFPALKFPATFRHAATVCSVAFSPDGRLLAVGCADGTMHLWDVRRGVRRVSVEAHADIINSIAFDPTGEILASGSTDKTIKIWKVTKCKFIATLRGHQFWVMSVAFQADGTALASGDFGGVVKRWDTSLWKNTRTIHLHTVLHTVAYRPKCGLLAACGMGPAISVWNFGNKKQRPVLAQQADFIHAVFFQSTGQLIAIGTSCGNPYLWYVSEDKHSMLGTV